MFDDEVFFMPAFTNFLFPEGEFSFVYCHVSLDERISYDSFIGVGVNVADVTKASESFQLFDSYNVFSYVEDLKDFFRVLIDGGGDYRILGYEQDNLGDPLFSMSQWDEVKNDYVFWGKYDF